MKNRINNVFRNVLLIIGLIFVVIVVALSGGLVLILYNVIQEKKRSKRGKKE